MTNKIRALKIVVVGAAFLALSACELGKLPPDPRIPQLRTTNAPASALVDHYMVAQCTRESSKNCVEHKSGKYAYISEDGNYFPMDVCMNGNSTTCIVPRANGLDYHRVNLPLPQEKPRPKVSSL